MCLDRSLGSFCLFCILQSARVDARVGDNRLLCGVCARVGARAVVYCCLFALLSTNLTCTFSTSEIQSENNYKKHRHRTPSASRSLVEPASPYATCLHVEKQERELFEQTSSLSSTSLQHKTRQK